jgi:putative methionine-R-sulfoxide reductase with GAF domain
VDPLGIEKIYDKGKEILSQVSWFPITLAIIVLGVLLVMGIFLIVRVAKGGEELNIFGLIHLKPNIEFNNLKEQFSRLNEFDILKSNVLKLLNQTYMTLPKLEKFKDDPVKLGQQLSLFYDFFLPGILTLISKQVDDQQRIAVFIEKDNNLKILRGNGYSLDGLKFLTLKLSNSKAGYAFINKVVYHSNDLTADTSYVRNPKASKVYKSLICIPIEYNGIVLGILNVDGLKEGSFDKDDIDYLTYFANALAPILKLQLENTQISIFEEENTNVS